MNPFNPFLRSAHWPKNGPKALLRVLCGLCAMHCLACLPAHAQSLDDPRIEGVLFFQEHPFAGSPQSAWPVEYRSAAGNDRIIIIVTADGQRMRLPAEQVPTTLPYPGRGGLTRQDALQLCDNSLALYPQYSRLLTNIRHGWATVSPRDYAINAPSSAARQSAMSSLIQRIVAESEAIRKQVADTILPPFLSFLDKPVKPAPPQQSVGDTTAAGDGSNDASNDTTSTGGDGNNDSGGATTPMDTQQSLQVIKTYYKKAEQLENGTP